MRAPFVEAFSLRLAAARQHLGEAGHVRVGVELIELQRKGLKASTLRRLEDSCYSFQ